MAVGDKKEMKAQLKVLPWAEMKKHQKTWYQENFSKNRKVQEWSYEKKAKLDPREWDANKLQKALTVLVRYEAVLFASRTEEWIKKIDKSKDKEKTLKEAQQKLPGYFTEIYKKMTLKVDKAVDELASDKGESKKAIAEGEDIFKKAKELDNKEIFTDTAEEAAHVLAVLEKDLGKAGEDADAKAAAFSSAASSIRALEGSFKGVYKAKSDVVKDINTKAAKMSKDKKSDATMQRTGLQITRLKADTKKILSDMNSFQADLKQLHQELFKEDMDARLLKVWSSRFKAAPKTLSAAALLQTKLTGIKKTFKDAAKNLK